MTTFPVMHPKCSRCSDTGIILAHHKFERGDAGYAFKCSCQRADDDKRRIPYWDQAANPKLVPEFEDKKPSKDWFWQKFKAGDAKSDPEFQARMKIWGRHYFEGMFKEWQEEQKSLPKEGDEE